MRDCIHLVPEITEPLVAKWLDIRPAEIRERGETVITVPAKWPKPDVLEVRTVRPKPGECPVCDA